MSDPITCVASELTEKHRVRASKKNDFNRFILVSCIKESEVKPNVASQPFIWR